MKTLQLSDARARMLLELVATEWAVKATTAAVDPRTIYNAPGQSGLSTSAADAKRRRAKVTAQAAELRRTLQAFGVEPPAVDLDAYVVPAKWSKHPGRKEFVIPFRSKEVARLRAEVLAQWDAGLTEIIPADLTKPVTLEGA